MHVALRGWRIETLTQPYQQNYCITFRPSVIPMPSSALSLCHHHRDPICLVLYVPFIHRAVSLGLMVGWMYMAHRHFFGGSQDDSIHPILQPQSGESPTTTVCSRGYASPWLLYPLKWILLLALSGLLLPLFPTYFCSCFVLTTGPPFRLRVTLPVSLNGPFLRCHCTFGYGAMPSLARFIRTSLRTKRNLWLQSLWADNVM